MPHTADLRVRADGDTLEEALSAALRALLEVVLEEGPPCPERLEPWAPTSSEPALALVELLGEALFRLQVRRQAVVGLRGGLDGALLEVSDLAAGMELQREVKAVTYNAPVCRRRSGGRWRCEVTLDL